MHIEDDPLGIVTNTDGHEKPSFTLEHRLKRGLWNVVYTLAFRPSPRPLHFWRARVLRMFGAKIGHSVHVYPKARIWAPWNLELHDESCIADDVICYSVAKITLKRRAIVSQGAYLCTGTHDYVDPAFQLLAYPIVIGEQAWICTDAFVGPGVEIGDHCVLGARSVAIKNLPRGMVCAGHPAKPLKPRYPEGALARDVQTHQ